MNLKRILYLSALSAFLAFSSCKKNSPTEPPVNHPPIIERIVVSPEEPFTEDRVRLECIVNDEDNDPLSYDWRSDGGYFDNIDKKQVMWNSPRNAGDYHITVKVDDKRENGTASRTISLSTISRFDTLYAVDDIWIFEDSPDENFQKNSYKFYLFIVNNDPGLYMIFSKFESSKRDAKSAKLRLVLRPIHPDEIEERHLKNLNIDIHKITSSWSESVVTYNNRPTYDLTPLKRFIAPFFSTIPITVYIEGMEDIINSLKNNPSQNYGLAFLPVDWDIYKSFYSKEGAQEKNNMNLAPAMIVEYE